MSLRSVLSPTLAGAALAMFAIAPTMAMTSTTDVQLHSNSVAVIGTVSSASQVAPGTDSCPVPVAGLAAPLPPFPPPRRQGHFS